MGKRSDFLRVARDAYDTPAEGVAPLLPHLEAGTNYIEPCAGRGALIDHLAKAGHNRRGAWDIEPRRWDIDKFDALEWSSPGIPYGTLTVITNPPWARSILHPLIERLSDQAPTWLLFDADWPHTRQAIPYLPRLRKIVSVGRLKWIPGTTMTGKDNCCWYHFTRPSSEPTMFFGRT